MFSSGVVDRLGIPLVVVYLKKILESQRDHLILEDLELAWLLKSEQLIAEEAVLVAWIELLCTSGTIRSSQRSSSS
jgi:hypothetical protein